MPSRTAHTCLWYLDITGLQETTAPSAVDEPWHRLVAKSRGPAPHMSCLVSRAWFDPCLRDVHFAGQQLRKARQSPRPAQARSCTAVRHRGAGQARDHAAGRASSVLGPHGRARACHGQNAARGSCGGCRQSAPASAARHFLQCMHLSNDFPSLRRLPPARPSKSRRTLLHAIIHRNMTFQVCGGCRRGLLALPACHVLQCMHKHDMLFEVYLSCIASRARSCPLGTC